mmetsp:Transcript_12495/g.38139  ORF Transcript_12495/g.38139 Transcript_12495/m.38139 type:complete len:443 (+) Transcript_12495:283-1611(+)
MLELTGCPTETVIFDTPGFDSERNWERLVSFVDSKFPLGCATVMGGSGLVQTHAYSVLDAKEIAGSTPGVQLKVSQFFEKRSTEEKTERTPNPDAGSQVRLGEIVSDSGTLRVLRLRNPWGKREWRGAWGDASELWTSSLRRKLDRGTKNDGTFWISYHDFLVHFVLVDVCKAHPEWLLVGLEAVKMGKVLEARPHCNTWAYIMAIQGSHRSKRTYSRYAHLGIFVLREQNHRISPADFFDMSCSRDGHVEILLEASGEAVYYLIPVSFTDHSSTEVFLGLMSAKPVSFERTSSTHKVPLLRSALGMSIDKFERICSIDCGVECARIDVQTGHGHTVFVARNKRPDRTVAFRLMVNAGDLLEACARWDTDSLGVFVPPQSSRVLLILVDRNRSGSRMSSETVHRKILCATAEEVKSAVSRRQPEAAALSMFDSWTSGGCADL